MDDNKEIEKYRKVDVRFRLLIFSLLKAANEAYMYGDPEGYRKAVINLERNLKPYFSKDYKENIKIVKKIQYVGHKDLEDLFRKQGREFSQLYDYEVSRKLRSWNDRIDLTKYGKIYELLIQLCHDRNLLLDIDVDVAIDDVDKIENIDEDGTEL